MPKLETKPIQQPPRPVQAPAADTAKESNGHAVPEVMTLAQVARYLNKHPATVGRWVKDGLLRAVRMPSGLPAICRAELLKFIGASALADIERK